MAWYKVDDQLHAHPKARRAGLEAMGLWTLAGSHAMSYLTDGFVEAWFVESWPHGSDLAGELVREGLWLEVPGGWQFHDWGKYQPTRESVLADREAAAARMKAVRENRKRRSPERSPEPSPNVRDEFGLGSASPSPTPELSKDSSSSVEAKLKETRLPSDWVPTKNHYDIGREKGIDVAAEADAFRLHAETHDRHAARWNAAFTTWLKRAKPKPRASGDGWMNRSTA
ncbi:hypothetical protein [Leucobacter japonicus]|uniref:hypothetical protein n=1 Tax=Leucobacter japonicus TaxID=1461259 RepID=UPI000ADBA5D6|nr:hypothetical protein [Leucobacter japonicus]